MRWFAARAMARAGERWQLSWVFRDDVYFEDGWDRYVATTRRCDDGYARLDTRDALRVLLAVLDAGAPEVAHLFEDADPGELEWAVRDALERGLTIHRRVSAAHRSRAAAPIALASIESLESAYVSVQTLDVDGAPLAEVELEVIAPDGSVRTLRTGPEGSALIERIAPGVCRVRLPRHDAGAWRGLSGTAQLGERKPARRHVVVAGECLSAIAHSYGLASWRPVWEHADNAALRSMRASPHVLHSGDVVMIPGLQMAELPCATNASHRIELEQPVLELKVTLADHLGRPFKAQPYQLWCNQCEGDPLRRGTTTGAGLVDEELPRGTRTAFLLLEKQGLMFFFQLSAVPQLPAPGEALTRADIAAIQARLNALGIGAGPATGAWNATTERALQSLRRARGNASGGPITADDLDALRTFGV